MRKKTSVLSFSSRLKTQFNLVALKIIAITIACFYSTVSLAEWAIDFQTPVSSTGRDILSLHHLVFYICLVIGIGVFSVMFYSMFKHRKSKGHKPASFHHSTLLEVIWTAIPVVILVVMAVPATKTLIKMEDTTNSDITIKVTGFQWFWRYEYQDNDVDFYSRLSTPQNEINNEVEKNENYLLQVDNEVVIPVGKKIRFLFTSADVIHAWWIPAFGVKKDAIPGYINESWTKVDKTGTYRGQCAELCGKDHGFMPIVVRVVTEEEYIAWVADTEAVAQSNKPNIDSQSANALVTQTQ